MPIDREFIRNQTEDQINQLLRGRTSQIAQQIAQTRGSIQAKRAPLLNQSSDFANALVGPSPAPGAANSYTNQLLDQNLNQTLSNQQRTAQNSNLNLTYQNALRRATDATGNRQAAEQFARGEAQNEARRQYQAQQQQNAQGTALARQDIGEQYQNRGLDLQQQYQNSNMNSLYQQALTRSLFGLGASLGTGYALNKYYANKPIVQPQQPNNSQPSSSSQPFMPRELQIQSNMG